MGKTAKWLRSLLGSPPPPDTSSAAVSPPSREKRSKWALSKSKNEEDPLASPYADGLDSNKHAIAVAAATAEVAEAALAAAQAAAEVVRLTSSAGSGRTVPAYVSCDWRRVAAAIKIQSAFRAYLARRALRALKGLVKLQSLVRGHIVRKQSADMLRRMQAMARIQRVANHPRSQWPDNAKHGGYTMKQSRMSNRGSKESSHMASNWLNLWMEQHSWNNRHDTSHGDDERSAKILEIDTWKPRQSTRRSDRAFPARNKTGQKLNPSISSEEVSSVISSAKEVDRAAVWTAESSPRAHSASSRPPTGNTRGMFTPLRSECSRSLYDDYLSHPSYMANTESSWAKVRSQSAPRQRMRMDELGVSLTFGRKAWKSDAGSEKGFALPTNYRSHTCLKRQPGAPHGYRI